MGFSCSIINVLNSFVSMCAYSKRPVLIVFFPIQIRRCGEKQCGNWFMIGDFVMMISVCFMLGVGRIFCSLRIVMPILRSCYLFTITGRYLKNLRKTKLRNICVNFVIDWNFCWSGMYSGSVFS